MGKALKVQKKSILGGKEKLPGEKEYKPINRTDVVQFTNKHGDSKDIIVDRSGINFDKLGAFLGDPKKSRRQKESMIAAFLFEEGKENASFIAELFLSKGTAMRDQQAFKSQMRFDYELITDELAWLLHELSNTIKDSLHEWKFKTKMPTVDEEIDIIYGAFDKLATNMRIGSDRIIEKAKKVTLDRMREQGFGIYISKDGKPYDVYNDGEEIVKVVSEDIISANEDKENESIKKAAEEREDC